MDVTALNIDLGVVLFMKSFLVGVVILMCAGCGGTNVEIDTKTLPAATVGTAYYQILISNNGENPYTWSISDGGLPNGLTLSAKGEILGTPTTAGTSTFTVEVSDSSNPVTTCKQTLTIQVSLATLAAGQSITLTTSGETILVPSGTIIRTTGGSTVTVNGDQNAINTSVGSIVSAPTSATGPADNTVIVK
ncbi:hypothetical protein F6V30_03780 [Oryzomonas sagensis]|uniref:Uncharacterized protein n=1 Tax=Oryzomonas sagensis TaxID=2603857 RepID=A0ABQ6TRR8_9BACT|nr:putative Ig domain-containing protein [Oryzomonas sagensis]KAB0671708.1 hypothetical protein F6V30_03780 [Oryzomonas sagensis]